MTQIPVRWECRVKGRQGFKGTITLNDKERQAATQNPDNKSFASEVPHPTGAVLGAVPALGINTATDTLLQPIYDTPMCVPDFDEPAAILPKLDVALSINDASEISELTRCETPNLRQVSTSLRLNFAPSLRPRESKSMRFRTNCLFSATQISRNCCGGLSTLIAKPEALNLLSTPPGFEK